MDRDSANKPPLRERLRELAEEVSALRKAIHEELDWREKSHPVDLDDWDDDDAI